MPIRKAGEGWDEGDGAARAGQTEAFRQHVGEDAVKFWQRRWLRGGLQRDESVGSVGVGFQPAAAGQPGGDDDNIPQQRREQSGLLDDATVVFHSGQRQQQVTGVAACSGRTGGAKQVVGCADGPRHCSGLLSHRMKPPVSR
jgi:hypothetical protein